MKPFFCFLLSFQISLLVAAQPLENTIKYIWNNETTKISASVDVYGVTNTQQPFSIFYLNNVDTVYNAVSDSLFKNFINISSLKCPVVKINFYNFLDTVPDNKLKLYAQEFVKYILADIKKKYENISTDNMIVCGSDYFGIVALYAAIANPNKINKTALFINENTAPKLIMNVSQPDAKKLKGKLYLYVNKEAVQNSFTDSLAAFLGVNSSAVLYKYDHFGKALNPEIFIDAYNWLLADGNNYIIKNVD